MRPSSLVPARWKSQYYGVQDRIQNWRQVASILSASECVSGASGLGYVCYAGLANRLRAHLIAAEVAAMTQRKLMAIWPKNAHCGAGFGELFEDAGAPPARGRRFKVLSYRDGKTIAELADEVLSAPGVFCILDAKWQYAPVDELRKTFLHKSISPLPTPVAAVLEEVESVQKEWPSRVLGIHLRRGDFVRLGRSIPLERYRGKVLEILGERPDIQAVFLATDASADELKDTFRDVSVPVCRREYLGRNATSGVLSALVDLVLLSRTQHLMLTPQSTFGELAALVGSIPVSYP